LVDPEGDAGIYGADADITEVSFKKNNGLLDVAIKISGDFRHEYSFFVEFYTSPDAQPTRLSMGHGNRTALLALVTLQSEYQASLIFSDKQRHFPLECFISGHYAVICGIPPRLLKGQNRFWITAFSEIDYSFWQASQKYSVALSLHLLWKTFDVAPDEGLFEVVLPMDALRLEEVQIEQSPKIGKPLDLWVTLANDDASPVHGAIVSIQSMSPNLLILKIPSQMDIAPGMSARFHVVLIAKTGGVHWVAVNASAGGWETATINDKGISWPVISLEMKEESVSTPFVQLVLLTLLVLVGIAVVLRRRTRKFTSSIFKSLAACRR